MKTVKFEITDEQAKRWEVMLGDYFAEKSEGEELVAAYRDAGLNVLTRLAMFQFIKSIAVEDLAKAEAAMNQEAE